MRITTPAQADAAIDSATRAQHAWNRVGGARRAEILETAADLLERDRARLMAVIVREAGKTLEAAQGDVREAVDYLRYYAIEARRLFGGPVALPGPTGERNTLTLNGRGVFACISPWNFPLAIFIGQVAAALAAGNTVLAKPAEQTPITAYLATRLLHEAGVPASVLHLLTGQRPARRGARQGPARQRRRRSPARTRRPGRSSRCSPSAAAPSCPSSPRPAGSTP